MERMMEAATSYRVVFITIDSYERARQIARTLVSEHLAACCNIIPGVTSVYSWNNIINEDSEFLMLLKTSDALLDSLEQRVRELHPYDVPEIISTAMDEASQPYAEWIRVSLQQ